MREVLFASTNSSKLAQFQFVADTFGFGVTIVSAYKQFPNVEAYGEDYATQQEIIEQGSREIYAQIQTPIIVEDTILEVDALGGRPGLLANEYLKEKGRAGLLQEMQNVDQRMARITSVIGYFDGKECLSFTNRVTGSIARAESFKKGEPDWVGPTAIQFGGGFNAIFLLGTTRKTLADFSANEGLTCGYREPNFKRLLVFLSIL